MHRKDYQAIAQAIRQEVEQWPAKGTHYNMAQAIAASVADALQRDNKAFSRDLFMRACGFVFD